MVNPLQPPQSPQALSVSELNGQVKRLLEVSYNRVWVRGELSSFSRPSSGHWYFSLKDQKAQIRCAMFRGFNQRLRFQPKEGDELLVLAKVSLYEGRGDYQLIVENMEPSGIGQLQAAFEQLKAKLFNEGLFDDRRKKPIPSVVKKAYIITSATGAAIHDIISVTKRRFPALELLVLPVQVQGEGSARDIAAAIVKANSHRQGDVIVVGRGGGSLEDLWAFNEEVVARAIAESELPIISAVGHEVDFTIADFVADYRAPTPSAAAEKITPDQFEMMQTLDQYQSRLLYLIQSSIKQRQQVVMRARARLQHPGDALQLKKQKLNELEQRLVRSLQASIEYELNRVEKLRVLLENYTPTRQLEKYQVRINHLQERLSNSIERKLEELNNRLTLNARSMHVASPLATLGRGYAIVGTEEKPVIRRAKDLAVGDLVTTTLSEGSFTSEVKSTSSKGLEGDKGD